MGNETEPAKLLLPYLQRADELQKHEPLVSYYCRLYAMERGLRIPQKDRTKTTNALLVSLMNQLEKDKKSVQLGPEDNLYVEGFASNVFAKADKQDRAARADLSTAKTFYAASIFFEILSQFGELQPDIEQKQKYAVWKAAEIRKALKEGRRPEPGPPGGDKDLSVPSSSPTNTYDLGPRENLPSSQLDGYTSSQPGDKVKLQHQDLGRRESFQASYTGADLPNPHVDKSNLHGSTQDFGRRESFRDSYTGADLPNSHADKASLHGSTQDLGRRESFPASYTGADLSTPHVDNINLHGPTHLPPSPSAYSSSDYSSSSFHQPPSASRPDVSAYPQTHQQPYLSDQHSLPQSYNHPPEIPSPSYSYPNFQSYPGFQDSTFPTAPTHQPSYFHAPDVAYSHQSPPPASNQSTTMYDSGNRNGNHPGPQATSTTTFKYDPNYQPPVEKITEAHKAARFAVGALAFDDVPVAVDFLRRSLELLTNPSAETH